jgi:hypothetical protein
MKKITSKSMRIIIDIPDKTDFNWSRAFDLWKSSMPTTTMTGQATRSPENKLGYCWYKVDPKTNIPLCGKITLQEKLPMPGGTPVTVTLTPEVVAELTRLHKDIYRIETIARRLKANPGSITVSDRAELINDVNILQNNIAEMEA